MAEQYRQKEYEQVGHCRYRAQRSSVDVLIDEGVGARGETLLLAEEEEEDDRSDSRIVRLDVLAREGVADSGAGGGTGAWHPGRGQMQYVGSGIVNDPSLENVI